MGISIIKCLPAVVAILSFFPGTASAQRCIAGMSAIELRGDMADGFFTNRSRDCGFAFGVGYSRFNSHANTWNAGAEYLQVFRPYGERGKIPVVQFTGEAGVGLHIISDYSQTFHLYGTISALAGYETVNWNRQVLPDGSTLGVSDSFIYGGALTLSADFYLSDRVVLTANVKERLTVGSDVQLFHTQYGIGIKFIID